MLTPDPNYPAESYFAPTAWIVVVVLGLLVALAGLSLMKVFPQSSYAVQPGYGAPVFALEMARTAADVEAVIGPPGDTLRAQRVAKMDKGNKLDFVFLTLYSLYMAAFFFALMRVTGGKRWVILVAVALAAGLFDAAENMLLLNITADHLVAEQLELLHYAAWGKFLCIFICLLFAARYIQSSKHGGFNLLGWIAIAGAVTIPAAYYSPAEYGWLVQHGVTAGWIAMLLYALVRAISSRRLMRARSQ